MYVEIIYIFSFFMGAFGEVSGAISPFAPPWLDLRLMELLVGLNY